MAFEIKWTRQASLDFSEICSYLADQGRAAAKQEAANIMSKIDLLAQFPLMGPVYLRTTNREYRAFVVGNYRVAYHVDTTARVIYIGPIRHGARDEPELH